MLEREDDGDLYGVLSLHVIENEMTDIKQLMEKLNSTTEGNQLLTANATKQVDAQVCRSVMSSLKETGVI